MTAQGAPPGPPAGPPFSPPKTPENLPAGTEFGGGLGNPTASTPSPQAQGFFWPIESLESQISRAESDLRNARTGWERNQARELLKALKERKSQVPLRLSTDEDLINRPPQRWLVRGIIPETGVGAVFGARGTFKSFLLLDMMAHVANGLDWFGKTVIQAPCVYVPFEGRGGIPKRVQAWRDSYGMKTNIHFILEPMNLRKQKGRDALVEVVTAGSIAGGILGIDTLASAAGSFDENSSKDMGEMIAILQELQQRLGGFVEIVHHAGKDLSRGLRGHSSLDAAVDVSIQCYRDPKDAKTEGHFKLDKVKDDEDGNVFDFYMEKRLLDLDEEGEPTYSLVLHEQQRKAEDVVTTVGKEDDFIDAWIRQQVTTGARPTTKSLEAQLQPMRAQHPITRDGIRNAVARLLAAGRLTNELGGPGGSKWLRPIDKS